MEAYFTKISRPTKKPLIGTLQQEPEPAATDAEITRRLLNTLTDARNPITHSDLRERSDRIISLADGRQVAEDPAHRKDYHVERAAQLGKQRKIASTNSSDAAGILSTTRIYLNGHLQSTTDIELKKIITEAGGEVVLSPSRATHIVGECLSASKTNKILNTKSANKKYVVKTAWVFDSIAAGKRRPERLYTVARRSANLDRFLQN